VKALSSADALLLAEVYPHETPIVAADGRSLAEAIRVAGKTEPVFVEKISDMADAIRKLVRSGDVRPHHGRRPIGGVPRRSPRRKMKMTERSDRPTTVLRGICA